MKKNLSLFILSISLGICTRASAQCEVGIYESGYDSTFTLTAYPYDSLANYSFLWSTGDTTAQIANLTSGTTYCVTASFGGCVDSACYTYVLCNLQSTPVADQTFFGDGNTQFTVQLQNNVSGGTAPFTYSWESNNGTALSDSTQENPTAVITESTCFWVTVTDSNGCTGYGLNCFEVIDTTVSLPCEAIIVPDTGNAGHLIAYPSTFGSFTFEWNTGETTQDINVTIPGFYCVTITSSNGCVASNCFAFDTISGDDPACSAAFISYYDENYPNEVFLVNISFGVSSLSYTWDFGDGTNSTDSFPTHVYASNGLYNVCLAVSDGSGCFSTFCDTVGFADVANKTANGFTLNVIRNLNQVGVEDLATVNQIKLYPNPAKDELFIEFNDQKLGGPLYITDLLGNTIQVVNVKTQSGRIALDIQDLKPGIYFVNQSKNQSIKTFKFIKE